MSEKHCVASCLPLQPQGPAIFLVQPVAIGECMGRPLTPFQHPPSLPLMTGSHFSLLSAPLSAGRRPAELRGPEHPQELCYGPGVLRGLPEATSLWGIHIPGWMVLLQGGVRMEWGGVCAMGRHCIPAWFGSGLLCVCAG